MPILVAISLHSINNLSAFLANYGPAGELVKANYIGMLLGSINTSVSVAGFLALIGTALVLDLFSLSKLSIDLQKGLDSQRLEVLANPFYHLLAHASWSWKLAGETAAKEVQRTLPVAPRPGENWKNAAASAHLLSYHQAIEIAAHERAAACRLSSTSIRPKC